MILLISFGWEKMIRKDCNSLPYLYLLKSFNRFTNIKMVLLALFNKLSRPLLLNDADTDLSLYIVEGAKSMI
jgi:hypothetical protein